MHYVAAFVSEFCMYANLILFLAVLFPCVCVSVRELLESIFFKKRIIIFLPSVKLKRIQFKNRCTTTGEWRRKKCPSKLNKSYRRTAGYQKRRHFGFSRLYFSRLMCTRDGWNTILNLIKLHRC